MRSDKPKSRTNENDGTPFTKEQLKIVEKRRAELLSGKVKGITDWKTMLDEVRKRR